MQWYSPVAFNKCIHRPLIRSWHISWGSRCNCGEAEGKGGAWARWEGSEPVGWVLACCCSPVGWGGCRNAAPMIDSSAPCCLKAPRIPLETMKFKFCETSQKPCRLGFQKWFLNEFHNCKRTESSAPPPIFWCNFSNFEEWMVARWMAPLGSQEFRKFADSKKHQIFFPNNNWEWVEPGTGVWN